jgi:predicted Rossmann fold flavoprotein
MNYDIVVIGGGPAGLLAAGKAAFDGASVLLLEKKKAPGSKLLITGNGRCNITNNSQRIQFQHKVLAGADFLEMPLKLFSPNKFMIFLEGLGIPFNIEKDNTVFPKKNSAVAVRDALRNWTIKCGVDIKTHSEVTDIINKDSIISSVKYINNDKNITVNCKSAIIATGGLSYPETGSNGDGYQFAEKFGHSLITPMASLVPIALGNRKNMEPLQGVALKDARLYLWSKGKKIDDKAGDILFTHFGISGPTVLDISRSVSSLIKDKKEAILTLDFIPQIDEGILDKELVKLLESNGKKSLITTLKEYVNIKVAEYLVINICKLDKEFKSAEVTVPIRKTIRAALKRLELPLKGTLPIDKATVTAGGINTDEINPNTMESYIVSGLYFAGEVMNIDAYCGGFNLQIAYSTGRLAGMSAAESIKS